MTQETKDRFFDSNGVPIRYMVYGGGQAVVLLHGLTGRIEWWSDQGFFDHPFDRFQLIPMDCRGHGNSGNWRIFEVIRQDFKVALEVDERGWAKALDNLVLEEAYDDFVE